MMTTYPKELRVQMADDEATALIEAADGAFKLLTQLSPECPYYKETVAKLLNRIKPGSYDTPLFNALARLTQSLAFEAVVLRVNEKTSKIEVYVRQRGTREEGETVYISQWHAPGSVKRPGERWRDVANRLEKEFGTRIAWFERLSPPLDTDEERGSFESTIFAVELAGEPRYDDRHRWVAVDDLPQVTVDHHEDHIIPMAVLAFAAQKRLPFKVRARIEFVR
jgi:hypothetical protein